VFRDDDAALVERIAQLERELSPREAELADLEGRALAAGWWRRARARRVWIVVLAASALGAGALLLNPGSRLWSSRASARAALRRAQTLETRASEIEDRIDRERRAAKAEHAKLVEGSNRQRQRELLAAIVAEMGRLDHQDPAEAWAIVALWACLEGRIQAEGYALSRAGTHRAWVKRLCPGRPP